MRAVHILIATSFALTASACGGSSSTAPGQGGSSNGGHATTINASPSLTFSPSPDTVSAGTSVTWAFGTTLHTVTWDTPGSPADIPVTMSASIARTMPLTAGTYTYHCSIHPSMHGTVIVQ